MVKMQNYVKQVCSCTIIHTEIEDMEILHFLDYQSRSLIG